jgi:hypothetical protein
MLLLKQVVYQTVLSVVERLWKIMFLGLENQGIVREFWFSFSVDTLSRLWSIKIDGQRFFCLSHSFVKCQACELLLVM